MVIGPILGGFHKKNSGHPGLKCDQFSRVVTIYSYEYYQPMRGFNLFDQSLPLAENILSQPDSIT